jgi:hypothetical protein
VLPWRPVYAGLLADEATPDVLAATQRRIVVYQALYASAAALCVVNTYLAIACLILLQLNSVIGPRIGLLSRL